MFGIVSQSSVLFRLHSFKVARNSIRRGHGVISKSLEWKRQKYCMDLVQKYDYENFLCTLLLTGSCRRYAFAIRALNIEVSKIGLTVSEERIANLKLRFWLDSIDKCFDKNVSSYVSDQPILHEIKHMADNCKVTKTYLKRLIFARERPLNKQFTTLRDMEDYAEQSVSPIYYTLLEICHARDIALDHAASHLGKAQGITNLLRAIPHRRNTDAVNIPQEILIRKGISQERIIRATKGDKDVEDCIFEVATIAHQHLEKVKSLRAAAPRGIKPIFLPGVAVERFLERLRRANFRLSNQRVLHRDTMLALTLLWNKVRSKIWSK